MWDSSNGKSLLRRSPLSRLDFISFVSQSDSCLSNCQDLRSHQVTLGFWPPLESERPHWKATHFPWTASGSWKGAGFRVRHTWVPASVSPPIGHEALVSVLPEGAHFFISLLPLPPSLYTTCPPRFPQGQILCQELPMSY